MNTCLEANLKSFNMRHIGALKLDIPVSQNVELMCQVGNLSAASSQSEEVLFSDSAFCEGLTLVFYGFGSGQHIRDYISQQGFKNVQSVIIVEKNIHNVVNAFSKSDWTAEIRNPNIEWFIGCQPDQVYHHCYKTFLDLNLLSRLQNLKTASLVSSMKTDGAYYFEVHKKILEASTDCMKAIKAHPEDHLRGMMNIIDNLDTLEKSENIESYINAFKEKIGVVVSTGPSLNHSIQALKKIREYCVVVAADSALAVLLKNGVKPDFVCCLERVVATNRLFEGLSGYEDIPLIYVPVVFSETLAAYRGKKISILSKGTGISWLLPNRQSYILGSTVATMALKCVSLFGCKNVLLFGQDLAFKRNSTQSHAEGANEFIQKHGAQKCSEKLNDKNNQDDWVEGNNGEKILSWDVYKRFAKQISHQALEQGINCFNVIHPDYGMKINNVKHIHPDSILESLSQILIDLNSDAISYVAKNQSEKYSYSSLKSNVQKACDNLRDISNVLLTSYIDGERFYHRNFPSVITEELTILYREYLSQCEAKIAELFKNSNFISLVWPYIYLFHVNTFSEYYSAYVSHNTFDKKEKIMFYSMRHWFKEAYFWSQTVMNLLKEKI